MIDLHLHTTASDGTLAPAALVGRVVSAGITIFSVTDHDTTAGLEEATAAARRAGIVSVPGIEITAVERGQDVHVLGYFFEPRSPELVAFLTRQRADRVRRVREMAGRLRNLGCEIDVDTLLRAAETSPGRSVGRPMLADALVAAGHAFDRNDAFDRFLASGRPAFLPRQGSPPEDVIQTIRRAGGIASLAHPGLARVDELIPRLAEAGLAALEACHADHDALTEARYRTMAAGLGLAISGGSDFHGDTGHRRAMLGQVTLTAGEFAALEALAAKAASR